MDTYFLGSVFLQRWSTFAWAASIKKGKTLEATEEEEEGRGESGLFNPLPPLYTVFGIFAKWTFFGCIMKKGQD